MGRRLKVIGGCLDSLPTLLGSSMATNFGMSGATAERPSGAQILRKEIMK